MGNVSEGEIFVMKNFWSVTFFGAIFIFIFGFWSISTVKGNQVGNDEGKKEVKIVKPANGAKIASPFEICMETSGVEVESARMGVNPGKGHHHILVDIGLPSDISEPLPKNENHIHMGGGTECKEIHLSPGDHTLMSLFAYGNHVSYDPPITDTIIVTIE